MAESSGEVGILPWRVFVSELVGTALLVLGRYGDTDGNFVLVDRRRSKADGAYDLVESGGEALVEAVE